MNIAARIDAHPSDITASGFIDFEFEELPLMVEDGFHCLLVSGRASVSYYVEEGGLIEWFVREIYADGYRKKAGGAGYDKKLIEIERGSRLYIPIWSQLTDNKHYEDQIYQAVVNDWQGGE